MNHEIAQTYTYQASDESNTDWLKSWGFDPVKESQFLTKLTYTEKKTYLLKNLESFKNEVLLDESVSLLYQYYIDDSGTIFTHENKHPEFELSRQIDPRERNGLYEDGINKAIHLAISTLNQSHTPQQSANETNQHYNSTNEQFNNPHPLIALYSPPGPASFDSDPTNPFSSITYTYGQLYLMRWNGYAIDALAVKVNGEGDKWMQQLNNVTIKHTNNSPSEQWNNETIKHAITAPFAVGSFDDLQTLFPTHTILYTKHDGTVKSSEEIVESIKQTFNSTTKAQTSDDHLADQWINETNPNKSDSILGTKEYVERQYYTMIYEWARERGMDKVTLSGSCGGSTVDTETLGDILESGNDSLSRLTSTETLTVQIFGSNYRAIAQSEPTYDFKRGKCAVCGKETDVGPCSICHTCEEKMKKEE